MRFVFWTLALACAAFAEVDVKELVHRSVLATDRNWKEAPAFTFAERDLEKGKTHNTYQVSVLEGSEYRKLIRRNDQPLTPDQQKAEERKVEDERARRKYESAHERNKRISKYTKERQQDQAMMREMTEAFEFKLAGEERVDGHECYLLNANPKPGYVPKTRDTKVLTGMRGKLWVDKESAQWVKVEAEVIHPVSFYAVATVGPGTRFVLEQEPVGNGIWLPKHFAVDVRATVLFFSHNSNEDETYSDYHRTTATASIKK